MIERLEAMNKAAEQLVFIGAHSVLLTLITLVIFGMLVCGLTFIVRAALNIDREMK